MTRDGTLSQRQSALDSLRALTLEVPEHVRAREVCHAAHLQLLHAEASQLAARKALEEATRAQAGGGPGISPERAQAIAADLQRSNDALAASKQAFPECEQVSIALTREAR